MNARLLRNTLSSPHSQRFAMAIRFLFSLALLLPALTSAQSTQLRVPATIDTLPNGLTLIVHEDHSVPRVVTNVWFRVGSGDEKPGRTGFAHLFEHLMFMGSENAQYPAFDKLLESAGAANNGSTTEDRTNYYETGPSNSLPLMLWLEADRMGWLLPTMDSAKVDAQRDIVKNERRQSYENRPYGMASIELDKMLWPAGHPYSWPTIGYMEDLTAASYDDVVQFFKKYYAPNNASLVVAGDIDYDAAKALVEKWFGEVPKGEPVEPIAPPPAVLTSVKRQTMTDRVRLSKLFLGWLTPRVYSPGDAALDVVSSVLAGGKNSRLYKRLIYDTQMAQDVEATQQSGPLGSSFIIETTVRPGHTVAEVQKAIDEELARLRQEPPSDREVQRALNQIEASFYRRMQRVGSFGGKADQLNSYFYAGGGPDYFAEDLARYTSLSASDVQAAASQWLPPDRRVELTVNPEEKK